VHLSIFSGDKLLGGPQAGILVGRRSAVDACRKNPMARALRIDKMAYAALEATLLSFVEGKATTQVPVLRMLAASKEEIRERSEKLVAAVDAHPSTRLSIEDATSRVGGGAAADAEIPTAVIVVSHDGMSADALMSSLRNRRPPVIARISEGRVLIDLRTVAPEHEPHLRAALSALV
jgi:L-seryl-tRNA(Ser) seleniumtransferase